MPAPSGLTVRPWLLIAGIGSVLAVVIAAVVVAILVSAAGSGEAHVRDARQVTVGAFRSAASERGGPEDGIGHKSHIARPNTTAAAAPNGLVSYRDEGMTAAIPNGWVAQESAVAKENDVESKWRRGGTYVLIDESLQTRLTARQDAEP